MAIVGRPSGDVFLLYGCTSVCTPNKTKQTACWLVGGDGRRVGLSSSTHIRPRGLHGSVQERGVPPRVPRDRLHRAFVSRKLERGEDPIRLPQRAVPSVFCVDRQPAAQREPVRPTAWVWVLTVPYWSLRGGIAWIVWQGTACHPMPWGAQQQQTSKQASKPPPPGRGPGPGPGLRGVTNRDPFFHSFVAAIGGGSHPEFSRCHLVYNSPSFHSLNRLYLLFPSSSLYKPISSLLQSLFEASLHNSFFLSSIPSKPTFTSRVESTTKRPPILFHQYKNSPRLFGIFLPL